MERETLLGCHFHKYTALGNDYLVLDPHASVSIRAAFLTPERIRALCDRHRGIGADGIVVGPLDGGADYMRIRIFNPDGSEAEKSGNGIRIFVRYAYEAGYVARESFTLVTQGGLVMARVLDERAALIEVDMGAPSFRSEDIPMTGEHREAVNERLVIAGEAIRVTCVSMGNPHCVIFDGDVSAARAQQLGPLVEHAPCFPRRTNVQLARVLDAHTLAIEIWERGAGYTLASGSSSCAAASAARRLGLVGDRVEIEMPGGNLTVTFRPDDGHALLTGPVAGVAHGYLHPDLLV